MPQLDKNKITLSFNIGIIIFLGYEGLCERLMRPVNEPKYVMDALHDSYPVLSILLMLSILLISFFFAPLIIRVFWNRFITDIFKIREITFQESLSIFLIAILIFGS